MNTNEQAGEERISNNEFHQSYFRILKIALLYGSKKCAYGSNKK